MSGTTMTSSEIKVAIDLTNEMRSLEKGITERAKQRRQAWFRLWSSKMFTQDELAKMCNVSKQVVYMEIRKAKTEQ
jgi:response regulator of citrate/malate metabolism